MQEGICENLFFVFHELKVKFKQLNQSHENHLFSHVSQCRLYLSPKSSKTIRFEQFSTLITDCRIKNRANQQQRFACLADSPAKAGQRSWELPNAFIKSVCYPAFFQQASLQSAYPKLQGQQAHRHKPETLQKQEPWSVAITRQNLLFLFTERLYTAPSRSILCQPCGLCHPFKQKSVQKKWYHKAELFIT